MTKRLLHRIGIILVSMSLSACATGISQMESDLHCPSGLPRHLNNVYTQNGEPLHNAYTGPLPNVYSGFIYDLQCFTHYGCDPYGKCGIFHFTKRMDEELFCFIDTPLSFVVDTALLPFTIYKQYKYGNICKNYKYTDDDIAGLIGLTGLRRPSGIAVDTINNQIFVANEGNDSLTVYGRTDSGNVAPARTIAGASTGLSGPNGIAVDTVNDQIFVIAFWQKKTRSRYTEGQTAAMSRR